MRLSEEQFEKNKKKTTWFMRMGQKSGGQSNSRRMRRSHIHSGPAHNSKTTPGRRYQFIKLKDGGIKKIFHPIT